MSKSIQRVSIAFLAAFGVLATVLGIWSIGSPGLVERNDNPRRVFAEQLVRRGAIVDRHDLILAETIPISGVLIRHYPYPDAAPAIGYYSINFGRAGVEDALDSVLRGPHGFIDELLHREQVGRNVRVTIDLGAQRDLSERFQQQTGAAVILSIPDGAVLAMTSDPTYDPNTLDANWKSLSTDPAAPLLNRATQGLYQPGAIFETPLLAMALETSRIALTATLTRPDQPVAIGPLVLKCARSANPIQTLADAYANACPSPFADLGAVLGESELISDTQHWRLNAPPPLEIRTAAVITLTADLSTTEALNAYAAGQGQLTVSPLQMALVGATIGNHGNMPTPFLVQDIQSIDGAWVSYHKDNLTGPALRVVSDRTARTILTAMRSADNVAGHGGVAYSGPSQLSWFIGLAPADQPRYAIAVLVEIPQGIAASEAEDIGRAALARLLESN